MTDNDSPFPIVRNDDGDEGLAVRGVINLLQDLVDLIPTEKITIALEPQEPMPGTGADYRASRTLLIHPHEKPFVFKNSKGAWSVDYRVRPDRLIPENPRPGAIYVNRSSLRQAVRPYDTWLRALKAANWDVEGRLADWVSVNDGLYD